MDDLGVLLRYINYITDLSGEKVIFCNGLNPFLLLMFLLLAIQLVWDPRVFCIRLFMRRCPCHVRLTSTYGQRGPSLLSEKENRTMLKSRIPGTGLSS